MRYLALNAGAEHSPLSYTLRFIASAALSTNTTGRNDAREHAAFSTMA